MPAEPIAASCGSCGAALGDGAFCAACGMAADAASGVTCTVCGTPNSTYARFCHQCGANLTAPPAERRIITVLFADLSGFTSLTERLDAEQVHALISTWLDPLCEAVIRWGGFIDKFIGDCVMALFGAPIAYENEPERAVRAALDMHAAFDGEAVSGHAAAAGLGEYKPRLSIGINTGAVVTGMFSSGGAWNYTAVGDTVNVAARLQGICEPGCILVGETTYEQTRHLFEFGEERILRVKGRTELVTARPVTGIRETRGQVRGFSDFETPLVGRRAELGQLRGYWKRAVSGHSQVCLLLGPAGIGKSRLVAELALAEGLPASAVVRGRSYPYASSTPWEPIAELIRDLHDVESGSSAPEAVREIVDRAPGAWPEDDRAGLGAVLGSAVSDLERLEGLTPGERYLRMVSAVSRALEGGVAQPTLLVLEDLHWADRTTLDFLGSVSELQLRGPFLLALLSRPPLPAEQAVAELIARVDERISLVPLTALETTELVGAVLNRHELPDDLLAIIYQRSGGNPLFIEEIVKALIDNEVIAQTNGVWRATDDYSEFTIPDSIDSVITTRIDGLDPSAKKVLQYAAIVGRRFWSGVVADALAHRSVDRELSALVAGALVRARPESAVTGDREYVFEHLLLQEVAYEGLLRGLRSEMHGVVAALLEERLGGHSGEFDELIAYHYERSTESERALPYLERAIDDAWGRGALLDAESLLDRAIAVAEDPHARARLLALLEEVTTAIGNDERRLDAIEELAALAESSDDPALRAAATYRRARRLLDNGELAEARAIGTTALEPFRELGDGSGEADVLALLGRVAHLWGAYDEALEHYNAALPLERAAGDRFGEAEILRRLGLAESDFGNYPRAIEYLDAAQRIYEEINHRPRQALTVASRAQTLRWLGRYEEAVTEARRGQRLAIACGSQSTAAAAKYSEAVALGAAGRDGRAKELLREILLVAPELHRSTLEARAWLALSELDAGEEAVEAVERARGVAERSGLIDVEIFGLTRLAELALEAGEMASADRHSVRAIQLLEEHGDVQGPDEVVYWVRSRVLDALHRTDEARNALRRAREIVDRTAAAIGDPELKRSFLENVDPNPRIMGATTGA